MYVLNMNMVIFVDMVSTVSIIYVYMVNVLNYVYMVNVLVNVLNMMYMTRYLLMIIPYWRVSPTALNRTVLSTRMFSGASTEQRANQRATMIMHTE